MPTITKRQGLAMGIQSNSLQTILLPKSLFSKDAAIAWLKKHKYKYNYIRGTTNEYRSMQVNPIQGAKFYSKKLPNGIVLVFQEF